MKPTSKNIVFEPSWNGIRSPWIGTKNIWNLFVATNLFDVDIYIMKLKVKKQMSGIKNLPKRYMTK
jgi:hypothetical protein